MLHGFDVKEEDKIYRLSFGRILPLECEKRFCEGKVCELLSLGTKISLTFFDNITYRQKVRTLVFRRLGNNMVEYTN